MHSRRIPAEPIPRALTDALCKILDCDKVRPPRGDVVVVRIYVCLIATPGALGFALLALNFTADKRGWARIKNLPRRHERHGEKQKEA